MSSGNLNNLSIKELRKLVKDEYNENKKLRQEKQQIKIKPTQKQK